MPVICYRGFYLGLLHVLHEPGGAVQAQWTWSHDGQSWARTATGCISLGDEGSFDSRMILPGEFEMSAEKLMYRYRGCDNVQRSKPTPGVATMQRAELDAWLDSLPQP
jgi:hypothetical protein